MKILAAEIDFADGMEYIASSAFATSGSDTPANQLFQALLADVAFERSVSFAIWRGDRSVVPAIQELVLPNADGRLDAWLDRDIKDRQVILRSGFIEDPYSTWPVRARLTASRVSQAGRTSLVLKFKSKLQRLDKEATPVWSDSTPNTEIRGSRMPIAIGQLLYAGGVLYQHYSNFERFYSVSYWPIHSIALWWSRYAFGLSTGYFVQGVPYPVFGLRRRSTSSNPGPDDRLCLEMRGSVRLGTEMLGSAAFFSSWTGDVPDGWAVTEGSGTVTQSPTGSARISGEDVWINWDGLTVGVEYYIEVLTTTLESGIFEIHNGATVLHYEPADIYLAEARVWRITFTAVATDVSIGVPTGATGTVVVNRVWIWPATPVDRIQSWVEHLCIDLGGLADADIDASSLAALEAAKDGAMAYANEQGAQISDLLWKALDSLNACLFEGLDGTLKATWLQDPADMSPTGTITDDDLVESWEWEDDEMDGLSKSLTYAVNYAQLSASEIQTLQSHVTISQAVVESLRRADRKVTSAVTVASHYTRSSDHAPAPSLLVSGADAIAEADSRCTLAASRRRFGRAALRDRSAFEAMEPGQCWTVISARWGTFDAFVTLVRGTLLNSEPVLRIRVWR